MAIASFGGYDIPGITSLEESLIDIAQTRRTVGGPERRDAVDQKRTWAVRVKFIDASIVTAIETHLRTILWSYDNWWIEDFGSTASTVVARIDASSWTKGRILGRPDLRSLSFTVIER